MASAGYHILSLQLGMHGLMHPSVVESLAVVACFLHPCSRPSRFVLQYSERINVGHACSVYWPSVNQIHKHCIKDASAFPFMQKKV